MFGVKPHGAMWQNAVFLATSRVGVGAASASRATPALVLHVQAAGDDWDAPYGRTACSRAVPASGASGRPTVTARSRRDSVHARSVGGRCARVGAQGASVG